MADQKGKWKKREHPGNVGLVSSFGEHTFHNANIPIERVTQEAAVIQLENESRHQENISIVIKKGVPKSQDQKERESPNIVIETIVPRRPNRRIGLRPTWSERGFQWSTATALAA